MNAHLSSEQFSQCISGQASASAAAHLRDCPVCSAELANFREALGQFREGVRAWSDHRANALMALPERASTRVSWIASHQLAWALLLAAVCVIASFVVPRYRTGAPPPADAVLLKQVDAELSRTAPASMEPLMKLVVEKQ